MRVHAIGAAPGIAFGSAYSLPQWEYELPDRIIDAAQLGQEMQRLYEGVSISKAELEELKQEISAYLGEDELRIFDAHIAILEDPQFLKEIQNVIRQQYKVAEVAVKEVMDRFSHLFEQLEDQVMQDRSLDIRDVGNRLLKHLIGAMHVIEPPTDTPYIVVARELTPSQLAHLDPKNLVGIAIMTNSANSHTAIMARAMGIPCVVGLEGKLRTPIQTGDKLIIDGERGIIDIDPDEETVARYVQVQEENRKAQLHLRAIESLPACTLDGLELHLDANVGFASEVNEELLRYAEGIGLYRTEFEYLDRSTWPTEEQLYQTYRSVVTRLQGKPCIFRTLDIGADKQLPYLDLSEEDNPSLGLRAIRFSLKYREIFKSQLRAILRASVHGPVKIMYPFISSLEEVRQAGQLLEEVRQELAAEMPALLPMARNVETGIMIELPSAVSIADLLVDEVDFVSIGSNDLVQYMLAVDRMNTMVSQLYDPYHPAIIRAFRAIAEAARQSMKPVSVCGELAADLDYLPVWIGLGITRLSMSTHAILPLKRRIRGLTADSCRSLVQQLLSCKTSEEIRKHVQDFNVLIETKR
jgi:phosphotransferase system enzyme I (PtsI)